MHTGRSVCNVMFMRMLPDVSVRSHAPDVFRSPNIEARKW